MLRISNEHTAPVEAANMQQNATCPSLPHCWGRCLPAVMPAAHTASCQETSTDHTSRPQIRRCHRDFVVSQNTVLQPPAYLATACPQIGTCSPSGPGRRPAARPRRSPRPAAPRRSCSCSAPPAPVTQAGRTGNSLKRRPPHDLLLQSKAAKSTEGAHIPKSIGHTFCRMPFMEHSCPCHIQHREALRYLSGIC